MTEQQRREQIMRAREQAGQTRSAVPHMSDQEADAYMASITDAQRAKRYYRCEESFFGGFKTKRRRHG